MDNLRMFLVADRDLAGIVADAPPQDVRHANASHSVMKGQSLYVEGCMLGLIECPRPTATYIWTIGP